jgi:hypothetical protein
LNLAVLRIFPLQRSRAQRILVDIKRQMFEEAYRQFKADEFLPAAAKKQRAREVRRKEDQGAGLDFFGSFLGHQRKNI